MRPTIQRKLILSFLVISLIPTALVIVLSIHMQDRLVEETNAFLLESLADEMSRDIGERIQMVADYAAKLERAWEQALSSHPEMALSSEEDLRAGIRALLREHSRVGGFQWFTLSEFEVAGRMKPAMVASTRAAPLVHVPGGFNPRGELEPDREWVGVPFEARVGGRVVERAFIGASLLEYDRANHFDQFQGEAVERFNRLRRDYPDADLGLIHAQSPDFRQSLEARPAWGRSLLEEGKRSHLQRLVLEERDNEPAQALMVPLRGAEDGRVRAILTYSLPGQNLAVLQVWGRFRTLAFATIPASVFFSIIVAVFLSRQIARPVRRLSSRAIAVSQGDYSQEIDVVSRDEVGDLAKAFNRMTVKLRQSFDEISDRARTIERQNEALDRMVDDLRRERAYVENILRTVSNGVITVDLAGRITRMNEDARETLAIPEVMGARLGDLLPDKGLQDILDEALDDGRVRRAQELTVRNGRGQMLTLALSTALLRSEDQPIGVVLSFSDLTRLRALQEQVRRHERLAALGSLTAGVAHEIRNPLGIIKGCAEILEKRFGGAEGENGLCQDIIQEVNRLSRVVTDFLDFARPRDPALETVNLDALLQRNIDLVSAQGRDRIEFRTALGAPGALVKADPEQFRQVFLNLMINAIEAMPDGGTLEVSTRVDDDGDHVLIRIADTGMGVSEEAMAQIFNPFFTTKSEGTGLGLSIVHRIVDSHGGDIGIESRPGEGATFTLRFPLNARLETAEPLERG